MTKLFALIVAKEAVRQAMKPLAVHANIYRLDPENAPPVMALDAAKYARYEKALKILEEMTHDEK